MRVLGLCLYPVEAASTRYWMSQFIPPLRENGIELTVNPFLKAGGLENFIRIGRPLSLRSEWLYFDQR